MLIKQSIMNQLACREDEMPPAEWRQWRKSALRVQGFVDVRIAEAKHCKRVHRTNVLQDAIWAHFRAVEANGDEPETYDLVLWSHVGITGREVAA